MELFRGRMGVCGRGSIICVLLSMATDKNYLRHNWMGREYGNSLLYYPTLEL